MDKEMTLTRIGRGQTFELRVADSTLLFWQRKLIGLHIVGSPHSFRPPFLSQLAQKKAYQHWKRVIYTLNDQGLAGEFHRLSQDIYGKI